MARTIRDGLAYTLTAIAAFVPLSVAGLIVVWALAASGDAQTRPIAGRHANAWSAAAVGISGVSASIDASVYPYCSAFGNSSAAATLTVQLSADNTNWYTSATNTGAVTGNFGLSFTVGARYVRLISNAVSTITATLQCKAGG